MRGLLDLRGHQARRRCSAEQGSSIVETVVVFPVFMIVVLLAVQGALWAHAEALVQAAASQGDRSAQAPGAPPGAGDTTVRGFLQAAGQEVSEVDVVSTVTTDDVVEVTVRADAESLLPWPSLPVSASATGPIQEFRESG
jgi:Flp pilus assembly protein TadG